MTTSSLDVLLGSQTPQILHLPPDVHSLAAATEAIELMASLGRPLDESQQCTITAALGTLGLALPELRVGLLHGRMKPAEKQQVMARFKAGELQLLVATTVVEVGVKEVVMVEVPVAEVVRVVHEGAEFFVKGNAAQNITSCVVVVGRERNLQLEAGS